MNHADLVAALREPSFYGPHVQTVEFLQTHISSIFLTGKRAYKLKKPVPGEPSEGEPPHAHGA